VRWVIRLDENNGQEEAITVRRLTIVLSAGLIMAIVMVAGAAPTLAQLSEEDKAARKEAKQQQSKEVKQEQKEAKEQQKEAKQQAPKQQQPLPKSGGVELNALLLPASVLLVGSGIVAAYGIRHYRRR
jgi:H+/gluconate symporter-like permease